MCIRDRHELEPVEHRFGIAVRIARAAMRPKAFARDDVLESVAVHVDERERVRLGKLHAVFVRLITHDEVLAKGRLVALAYLLEPRQTEGVRGETRDHI